MIYTALSNFEAVILIVSEKHRLGIEQNLRSMCNMNDITSCKACGLFTIFSLLTEPPHNLNDCLNSDQKPAFLDHHPLMSTLKCANIITEINYAATAFLDLEMLEDEDYDDEEEETQRESIYYCSLPTKWTLVHHKRNAVLSNVSCLLLVSLIFLWWHVQNCFNAGDIIVCWSHHCFSLHDCGKV